MRIIHQNLMRTLLCAALLLAGVSCTKSLPLLSASKTNANVFAVTSQKFIASVVAVDTGARTLTLKGDDGRERTFHCGKDMINFDQIKVGDRVSATVTDSLAVFMRKSDQPPLEGEAAAVAIAPQGDMPGVVMANTAEVRAKVLAINPYEDTITIETPNEMTTLQIGRDIDHTGIRKGDDVTLRVSEALALRVEAAAVESMAGDPDPSAVAQDAFIYGYPMVMNYSVLYEYFIDRKSSQYKCGFNELYNTDRVYTPADTTVVTPNSDTPYSFFCADLRAEPVIVTIPPIEKSRYYSVQLVDLYTFNYGYIGSRTTGNNGGRYMIAGPNWQGPRPEGVTQVFNCETQFSMGIIRTQLFNAADIDNVKKVQSGYAIQTLSQYQHAAAPPAAPTITWPAIDKQLAARDPFAYLNFVLQFCPATGPAAVEAPMRARFATIGVEAGKPFAVAGMNAESKAELEAGVATGMDKIKAEAAGFGTDENGWRVGTKGFGTRAMINGNWLMRAAAAMAGIYGNDADEALYPMLAHDSEGSKPDCTSNAYTLTFPAGQFPPANAFWSVTMYDGKTQLLVPNPINRYLINAPMLPEMKTNADGSLTLYIQHESPGKEKESNWLPAPAGPVYLVMRLYWPKPEALDGQWKPPAVVRVAP